MNKKRKIAIVAGSRGEYGYIRPIVREIEKRDDLDYGIIVTNMHVLERFGSSVEEVEKDNLKIEATIFNTLDGYNHLTMTKSLAIFMMQLPEIIQGMNADIVLVLGDRGEQLMASIVSSHMYKIVAHVQAGEVTGNIDGLSRHAITKFSHIHFAANDDAAERLLKMGEQDFRIHITGAPQLDEIVSNFATSEKDIIKKYNINPDKKTVIVLQHPVTEDIGKGEDHMSKTMRVIADMDANKIIIKNNSDAGSSEISSAITKYRTSDMQVMSNVPRQDYVGLMKYADVLVGNSSSGILEAPSFGLPAVNIGRRQYGRLQGINVINVEHDMEKIKKAIELAFSKEFINKMKDCVNPYGDGRASKRIVKILAETPFDEKLLVKRITY